jgi:hypothetical protein
MSTPQLSEFTKAMLAQYVFPGTDAAVVFVPEGQDLSKEIQAVLDHCGQQRWYPVEGGHLVKVPWHCSKGNEGYFGREKKGWDHENCDFCSSHVSIGELCWTAESGSGGFWLICCNCHNKVNE